MLKHCYVFDIDGTLADCSHRLHHIQKQPKDWDAFFDAVLDDKPIEHMANLAITLFQTHNIAFVSGRSDVCKCDTALWLHRHILPTVTLSPLNLYMRKAGDHRDDDIVKIEMLAQLRADGFEPIMVFDDRKRVVDAWRAAGIPCAQVAPGDF